MGRRAVDSKGGPVITLGRHKALGSLLYSVGIDSVARSLLTLR